jgi:integration host factor subunit alpha
LTEILALTHPKQAYTNLGFPPMSLTKDDLIRDGKENGYSPTSRRNNRTSLNSLNQTFIGEDVLISGFGKFCVKKKKERRGRNPATGEDMILAPRRVVTFKWSGRLRQKIN